MNKPELNRPPLLTALVSQRTCARPHIQCNDGAVRRRVENHVLIHRERLRVGSAAVGRLYSQMSLPFVASSAQRTAPAGVPGAPGFMTYITPS